MSGDANRQLWSQPTGIRDSEIRLAQVHAGTAGKNRQIGAIVTEKRHSQPRAPELDGPQQLQGLPPARRLRPQLQRTRRHIEQRIHEGQGWDAARRQEIEVDNGV
jgi:hypothetical protein